MGTITTTDGTEIFDKDWGSGQAIVFSHGWPPSADDWDTQMLFFLQHGYRVIAHDRRRVPRGHSGAHQFGTAADGAELKTYSGFPHGMPTTQAATINADLQAFLQS